jgi:hypothetical protein
MHGSLMHLALQAWLPAPLLMVAEVVAYEKQQNQWAKSKPAEFQSYWLRNHRVV